MIGDMIAKVRKEKGMSKTQLAKLTDINIGHLKKHLQEIDGVNDIHHIHIWSIDGYNN